MINYEEGNKHSCKVNDRKWDLSQIQTISYIYQIRVAIISKMIKPLNR